MRVVVFEDARCGELYPVSLTRAVFELKCGITSLLEKITRAYPSENVSYLVRDYLAPELKTRYPSDSVNELAVIRGEDILLVNGRLLVTEKAPALPEEEGWAGEEDELVLARVRKETLAGFRGEDAGQLLEFVRARLKRLQLDCTMVRYPWDLVNHNHKAIIEDFRKIGKAGIEGKLAPEAVIYGPRDQVYIARGAEVQPLVCLDTRCGPVSIDEGAKIGPFTRIEGPCYVGKKTIISEGKIREGCSIGPVCRIGGEVEESIFHGYSNKCHEGFIGHSYIGEWVNLGALTTNSDLKNDYSNVSVIVGGRPVDTGCLKVGCFIGDHTKTSIGTSFNTGTHVGALCIIVSSGEVLPKYVPSGSWFIRNSVTKGFGFRRLLETAEAVMRRRNVEITESYRQLLKQVYEIARPDRESLIKKARFAEG